MSSAISPAMASTILRALLDRCSEANSTPAFRSAVQQAIGCIARDELRSATTIINETCANVSGTLHDCGHETDLDPTPEQEASIGTEWADTVRRTNRAGHPLQADEDTTNAYHVLDGLRFGFGYLTVGVMGNNVVVLR